MDDVYSYVERFLDTFMKMGGGGLFAGDEAKIRSFMQELDTLRSGETDPVKLLEKLRSLGDEAFSQKLAMQLGTLGTIEGTWFPMTDKQVVRLQKIENDRGHNFEWDPSSGSFQIKDFFIGGADDKMRLSLVKKDKAAGPPTSGPINWNEYDVHLALKDPKGGHALSFRYNHEKEAFESTVTIERKEYAVDLVLGEPATFLSQKPAAGTPLPSSGVALRIKDGAFKGTNLFHDGDGNLRGLVSTTFGQGILTGQLSEGEVTQMALTVTVAGRKVDCSFIPSTGSFRTEAALGSCVVRLNHAESDPEKKEPPLDSDIADLEFAIRNNRFLKGLQFHYEDVTDSKGERGNVQLVADVEVDGAPYKLRVKKSREQKPNAAQQGLIEVDVSGGRDKLSAFSFAMDDEGVRRIGLRLDRPKSEVKLGVVEIAGAHGEAEAFMKDLLGPMWAAPGTKPVTQQEMQYYFSFLNKSVGDVKNIVFVLDEDGHVAKAQMQIKGSDAELYLGISEGDVKAELKWNGALLAYEEGKGFTGAYSLATKNGRFSGTLKISNDEKDPKKGHITSVEFKADDCTGTVAFQDGEYKWRLAYASGGWKMGVGGNREDLEVSIGFSTGPVSTLASLPASRLFPDDDNSM